MKTNLEVFYEAWLSSLVDLLSQLAAKPYTAMGMEEANQYAALLSVEIKLKGGLTGTLWLSASRQDAGRLLQLFLGEGEEIGDQPNEMQTEAIRELVQQWGGLAAAKLRPAFGEVSLEVALGSESRGQSQAARLLQAAADGIAIAVAIEIGPELMRMMDRRQPRQGVAAGKENSNATDMLRDGNFDLLLDVELGVMLRFGSRKAPLREVLELSPGAVLELNRQIQDPVDLLLNDRVIARGDVVVVDGNYGLRITEVIAPDEPAQAGH